MRYHSNNICLAERTNATDGQPENITPLWILWGGKCIKTNVDQITHNTEMEQQSSGIYIE